MSETIGNINVGNKVIDLDSIEYDDYTLLFLRKKLDNFTINLFKKIARATKEDRGVVKNQIDDYQHSRKKFDASFLMLEAQGFIERRSEGSSQPYYLTNRGVQLLELILKEEKKRVN